MEHALNKYDVVLSALQSHYDLLWKISDANRRVGWMTAMDDQRMVQLDELKEAMELWKNRNTTLVEPKEIQNE